MRCGIDAGRTLRWVFLFGVTGLAACVAQSGRQREKEGTKALSEPTIQIQVKVDPTRLAVTYTVHNTGKEPVVVFDRMWDMAKEAMDANWVYVEVQQGSANLKRAMELKPRGLSVEQPPVPYGRELAGGASTTGGFELPLPLSERSAYGQYVSNQGTASEVVVHQVSLALGWAPVPLPYAPPKPVTVAGEDLLYVDYASVASAQRTVTSQPVKVTATAVIRR